MNATPRLTVLPAATALLLVTAPLTATDSIIWISDDNNVTAVAEALLYQELRRDWNEGYQLRGWDIQPCENDTEAFPGFPEVLEDFETLGEDFQAVFDAQDQATQDFLEGVWSGNGTSSTQIRAELEAIEVADTAAFLQQRLEDWNLTDARYADDGWLQFLREAGYAVRRSDTSAADPSDWEYRGSPAADDFLTTQERAELQAAGLVILSPRTGNGANFGRAIQLRDFWGNTLTTPVILMNPVILRGDEFDFNWGWYYGFAGGFRVTDPETPAYTVGFAQDPVYFGLGLANGDPLPIYETDSLPPQIYQGFSNNPDFSTPSTVLRSGRVNVDPFDAPCDGVFNITRRVDVISRLITPHSFTNFEGTSQTVTQPRLYFTGGYRNSGIFNLTDLGKSIYLNAVGSFLNQVPTVIPVTEATVSGGLVEISIATVNGAMYQIHSADRPGEFDQVEATMTGNGSTMTIQVTPDQDREFFRAVRMDTFF